MDKGSLVLPEGPGRLRALMRRVVVFFARLAIISLVMGVAGGYYVANRYFNNGALARRLTENYNKKHRGRIRIGSIHWRSSAILELLRDGYDEVVIKDLRIFDSRGRLALRVDHAVGSIKLWDVILRGDFRLRWLRFDGATVRLERYRRPDGPGPKGEQQEIGLLGAFEPTRNEEMSKRSREKRSSSSSRSFIVVDRFELAGITLVANLGQVGIRLEELRLGGRLDYASAGDGQAPRLHYDLRPAAEGGALRFGHRRFSLGKLRVKRLAATRARPDRVVVDATLGLEGAHLSLRGGLLGLRAAPKGPPKGEGADHEHSPVPTVALEAAATGFGRLLARLTGRAIVDSASELHASLRGPITDPVGTLRLAGLGLRRGGIRLDRVQLVARYESGVLLLDRMVARALGGTLEARARLDMGSGLWKASLKVTDLDTRDALPADRREALGGTLHGYVDAAGHVDDLQSGWTRFSLGLLRHQARGPLPRSLRLEGELHASLRRLDIRRLELS